MGPLTWSLYVDTYYAWQFHQPIDHTIFPTTTAPAPQRDLAQPRAPRRRRDGPRRADRAPLHPVRLDRRDDRRAGHDDDARLLPHQPPPPVRPAGGGRLALPLAPRRQRRARDLPVVHRPRELPARGELGLHPRVHVRRDALLLLRLPRADLPVGQAASSSSGSSTAGRPSASGTRGAPAATCGTGGRASGSRSSTRSTRARRRRAIPSRCASTPTTTCRSATSTAKGRASCGRSPSRSSATSATSTAATRRRARWAASRSRTAGTGRERWKSTLRGDFFYDQTQAISPEVPRRLGVPVAGDEPVLRARGSRDARLLAEPLARDAPRVLAPHRQSAALQRPGGHHRARTGSCRRPPQPGRPSRPTCATPTIGCSSTSRCGSKRPRAFALSSYRAVSLCSSCASAARSSPSPSPSRRARPAPR